MNPDDELHLCICEDRHSMYPALRLLLSSLSLNYPSAHIHLFLESPTSEFLNFLAKLHLNIETRDFPRGIQGYDIKPVVLESLLGLNIKRILWVDSDIIVADSFRLFVDSLHDGVLVICEEMLGRFHGNSAGLRTSAWGFQLKRSFPFALNTGVLYVDRSHLALIARWSQLLASSLYRQAQALPWDHRPVHLLGDQDVLCALLGSAEFSKIDVRVLRRGQDIIQFSGPFGYTLRERLLHMFSNPPPFVHSLGDKPWLAKPPGRAIFDRFCFMYLGCSPYTLLAQKYQEALSDCSWLEPRNFADCFFRWLGFGSMPLTGLPYALAADFVRLMKHVRILGQRVLSFLA
jgi:hypothetical protein